MNGVIVRKSKIHGRGVFAERDFKIGEVVLKWTPRLIEKDAIGYMSKEDKKCIAEMGNKSYLMSSPERFVNHSCEPNTVPKNNSNIAVRIIKKGEEILADYGKMGGLISFKCNCGSRFCRGIIK